MIIKVISSFGMVIPYRNFYGNTLGFNGLHDLVELGKFSNDSLVVTNGSRRVLDSVDQGLN